VNRSIKLLELAAASLFLFLAGKLAAPWCFETNDAALGWIPFVMCGFGIGGVCYGVFGAMAVAIAGTEVSQRNPPDLSALDEPIYGYSRSATAADIVQAGHGFTDDGSS